MANILVADSGSTKTEWSVLSNNKKVQSFITPGINPYFQDTESIVQILKSTTDSNAILQVDTLYFYGAGCANLQKNTIVSAALEQVFNTTNIRVGSDLLAAARASCQNNAGIACILGTGSNSCYYDGKEIISNVAPLGYILGDEGSGAELGKRLVGNILKNQLPNPVKQLFFDTYQLNAAEILDAVYRQPYPNRYLAQFTKFISQNIAIPEIEELVLLGFSEFISRNILQYKDVHISAIHFTGSIAVVFKPQLIMALNKFNLLAGQITKAPMEGLLTYHINTIN